MVYDPITKDFVPRYGMGSIKKIEDKHNWLMEEKPKHLESGLDPFTYKKNEKKLEKEKQDLRELKNQISRSGPAGKGAAADQILDPMARTSKGADKIYETKMQKDGKLGKGLKKQDDQVKQAIKKREKKALMKSLQLAQISTGSMGKFDRKASKSEPNAPNSQVIKKKKSNKKLYELESKRSVERDRNMKILTLMDKEKELKAQGKMPKK